MELVAEVEARSRLKLISPWLEARQTEGSTEVSVYNALAKIYVDNNQSPERFLEENEYYDSKVVGKYCEKRDPILAFIAYKKNSCDDELIEVTNKNGLFKQQASYLVERSDEELWAKVLSNENTFMRHVIDQVVGVALPACKDANKVGSTVKAFMTAELPHELIELLEKIVLHGTDFSQNENLQNLLILTAIKADPTRVMDYIHRLDNYHGMEIANIAVSSDLFEEALAIFNKFEYHEEAAKVIIDNLAALERAVEYAEKVNKNEVWSLLAKAQVGQSPPLVKEAIASFIKGNDPNDFAIVAKVAEAEEAWPELISYLSMARKLLKEPFLDNTLVYVYARADRLADMEDFINGSHVAKLNHVGDRTFDEGLFKAARILYNAISAYGRLAASLVRLEDYSAAVDAARKANSNKTWKEVLFTCVEKSEFRLAQMCGINLIVSPDDLEMVVQLYEGAGFFEELITLLENGTNLDRAHMGIFTELGIQYARHRTEKLLEHLQMHKQRINVRKLQRTCEMCRLWTELAYLYTVADEYDNAVTAMMEHPSAWEHSKFKDLLTKVANTEYLYRAANHYLLHHPLLLVDLLKVVKPRLDNTRVVADIGRPGCDGLPLIREFLEDVQESNNAKVNDALNSIYIEEELVDKLRFSIENFTEFDQIALAIRLEKHSLLEFRRVAATVYKLNDRFEQSVALSKKDKLYKDAMETTADSGKPELAEELLRFFVAEKSKDCFAACLYHCFELIPPDVVMELAWRFDLMNLAMPFMIQTMRSLSEKVEALETAKVAIEEKVDAAPVVAPAGAAQMVDDSMNDGSAYYDAGMANQYATMIATTNTMDYSQNYYGGGY